MMDWNAFGVVAACAWCGLLLALGVGKISSLRLCASALKQKPLPALVFFVCAAIATVEAQKPGPLRVENGELRVEMRRGEAAAATLNSQLSTLNSTRTANGGHPSPSPYVPDLGMGAWEESLRVGLPDVFPFGDEHLEAVEIFTQGYVRPRFNSVAKIADVGARLAIVPGLTTFTCGATPDGGYRIDWTDAAVNRDTNNLMTAAIELMRNGDVAVTTNGVSWTIPRELPFAHDGFGQDAEWVAANFTNATEIAAAGGYAAWVDAQVGEGLTNGLYKLTVAVAEEPLEIMQIAVGDKTIAVTNAGEYAFLLKKGEDYGLIVSPASTNVTIAAVDDIPSVRGPSLLRSVAGGTESNGVWTPDGGLFATDYVAGLSFARLWWPPWLCGAPDAVHIDPRAGAVDFSALLWDCCGSGASFQWSASDGLTVASPSAQTTEVTADGGTDWALAEMSVTAAFGSGRSLTSYLRVSYGTNDAPQVSCSIAVQGVHFINEGDRAERVYPVALSLLCPVETNGTVAVEWNGNDGARFWADADATTEIFLPTNIPVGSVMRTGGESSFAFYMTSPQVGSGTLTALFTLPDGETRGVSKGYRVIEPLRRLVNTERDIATGNIFNPSRLVYGQPARLKVGCNGNFAPEDVEWRVVSGPGVVTRDEDDFGAADWTATVEATAASGEVVVEARFNADAIQPRFVLPIVQMRQIPIEAYIVCDTNGVGATTQAAIEAKLQDANIIWMQAGLQFQLANPPVEMSLPQFFVLSERDVVTNSTGGVTLGKYASRDVYDLMSYVPTNNSVRTFWVGSITNGTPLAFTMQKQKSVFMGKAASSRAFAHELGHALGLVDIYVRRKIGGIARELPSARHSVCKDFFRDQVCDWGAESDRGFYPKNDDLAAIISSLLMYGIDESGAGNGADVPSGPVLGYGREPRNAFSVTNVAVGVNGITE